MCLMLQQPLGALFIDIHILPPPGPDTCGIKQQVPQTLRFSFYQYHSYCVFFSAEQKKSEQNRNQKCNRIFFRCRFICANTLFAIRRCTLVAVHSAVIVGLIAGCRCLQYNSVVAHLLHMQRPQRRRRRLRQCGRTDGQQSRQDERDDGTRIVNIFICVLLSRVVVVFLVSCCCFFAAKWVKAATQFAAFAGK